jgi:hypothetical protein
MRFFAALPWLAVVVACSSNDNQPCTLTQIGAQCLNDAECCTGYCMIEGDAAYCQAKPKVYPACADVAAFCTQDRNCCSGLCEGGQCFGGGVVAACLALGSSCTQADSCCSVNCVPDGNGGTACAPQPQGDGGLSCGLPGAPCTQPGQTDPAECCFGVCGSNGQCAGGTTGGNNPNCKGSGGYCQYGSDCCSQTCEKVSSGFQCK